MRRNFYALVKRRDGSRWHGATIRAADASAAQSIFDDHMPEFAGFNVLLLDRLDGVTVNPSAPLLLMIRQQFAPV